MAADVKLRAKAARIRKEREQNSVTQATPKLGLLDWSVSHRENLIPDRPFDLVHHAYLKTIYACTAKEIVIHKAGQMGISEYLISAAMHACDQRNATVLYVFPTDAHVSDFSAARLGPAIEASPYLQSVLIEGSGKGGKRGSDKVTLKRIRNRYLYFRGAAVKIDGNASQLKSIDADLLVLDELDEMDQRAPAIAKKRLGHSMIGEIRYASTPTYHGVGIHAAYLDTNQLVWEVQCPACKKAQTVTIRHCVTEFDTLDRPTAWHQDKDGKPVLLCNNPKCKKPLPAEALTGEDGTGHWVSALTGYEYQPAEANRDDSVGFHVTKFMSPALDLDSIIQGLASNDETRRKEAINQDLGEPYKPKGTGITDADLDGLRGDYHLGGREACFMGVDVGSVLNVVIRAKEDPETGERKALYIGEVDSFEDVGRLIKQFKPVVCVIDALPETRKARELQSDFRFGQVWICYYTQGATGSKKQDPSQWDYKERQITADRTRTLDAMYGHFFDGINTLPAEARDIKRYYAQIKAPVRTVVKGKDGVTVAKYIESSADHYAHAENYCSIAASRPFVKATHHKVTY